jgi:hypothetical protein
MNFTLKTIHQVIKEELPEPYLSLAHKYTTQNKIVRDLPDAILKLIPWHPSGTDEGYAFWEHIYLWSKGIRKTLPEFIQPQTKTKTYSFNSRYNDCLNESKMAMSTIVRMFGEVKLNRETEECFKRYLIFNYLLSIRGDRFSYQIIGRAVAEAIGRSKPFNHASVYHAQLMDEQLVTTNDSTYSMMKRVFEHELMMNTAIELQDSNFNN